LFKGCDINYEVNIFNLFNVATNIYIALNKMYLDTNQS